MSFVRLEKVDLLPAGVAPAPDRCAVEGVVASAAYHGSHTTYTVESSGAEVKVLYQEAGRPRPAVGERVTLTVDPANVLQYDATDAAPAGATSSGSTTASSATTARTAPTATRAGTR
ncbi:TOBE domain-containing protein [Cellulomonas sp. ATA003]|uniref:TOBE domain-containing protein n=1 Tax=Cellulomonas sp. ATA003 TaxID=3073064 RepID=UPI0037BEF002